MDRTTRMVEEEVVVLAEEAGMAVEGRGGIERVRSGSEWKIREGLSPGVCFPTPVYPPVGHEPSCF